jgi:hypothetical protein
MGKSWMGLIVAVLIVLALRLYFAFQTPFYTSDEAYLNARAIEAIQNKGLLWEDKLGYGGRTYAHSPLFDAIIALAGLITPYALKILPNIFASLLVIPAFLIAHRLTKNTPIALFSSLLASVVPAYFSHTFNHATPLTLSITMFFLITYAWLKTPESWVLPFLSLLIIFVFLSPLSIVFVLSIALYILLISIEHLKQKIAEYELGLFAIFFTLWAQFLLYKKLILFHGPAVIWQNTPEELLSAFYANITILGAITQIGVFPLVDGMYALYKTAFKEPQKDTLMLLSITIVSSILLWLKLIKITTGLMLLGITLSILFSKSIMLTYNYLKTTKISKYAWMLTCITMIAAMATTAYPAYAQTKEQLSKTITREEVTALATLQQITPEDAIVIAPATYGNYITAIAKRKNMMDTYFFLQPRINERYQDLARLYKTPFETEAVELFDKYNADYLIVPPGTKDIPYGNSPCFKRIRGTNILIYEKNPECKVKVVS